MNSFVEPIFNMYKIKFDKLDSFNLFKEDIDRVVIYINLEAVFRTLLTPRIDNQLRASGYPKDLMKLDFISNIINLGQHYRLYCAKNKKSSRIILYWNYPRSAYKNRQWLPKYREDYDKKMFRNDSCPFMCGALDEIHDLLTTTIQYINEVYVVDGGVAESSIVPHILSNEVYFKDNVDTQYVVVSKSIYDYQYTQYGYDVLVPARDMSVKLTQDNLVDHMKASTPIKNPLIIPFEQIPTVLSVLGDQHRTIPKIDGYGLAGIVKQIRKSIESITIAPTTQSIEILREILEPGHRNIFSQNYRCINIDYQYKDLTPIDINHIVSQLVDKYDDDKVKEFNEVIFEQCPLMIISSRTEQIRNSERFHYDIKSVFR